MSVMSRRADFALAVPPDWCSLTRLDPAGVDEALAGWAGAVEELASFRGEVRAMLESEVARVAEAGGIGLVACAFLDCQHLVTGTAGVFVVPNPFAGADGSPVVDASTLAELANTELAPDVSGRGNPSSRRFNAVAVALRGDGTAEVPAMRVRMLATVPARTRAAGSAHADAGEAGGVAHAGEVGVDRVQHFVPILPDGRDVLVLDFLTPFLAFSDELIGQWEKVVDTFRWVPEGSIEPTG